MRSITQNNDSEQTLSCFVEEVCGESRFRVDEDFGGGFVRLKSSEAERRQAAQDIRSSEDIVLELLRNARDAGASRIYLAVQKDERFRRIVVLDDGSGIPSRMQYTVFEPRVTSKLDTAHMDKWGMHGRGMALYSIKVNAVESYVAFSEELVGTSLAVLTDTKSLGEKSDQSTFPRFEAGDGAFVMRGPRNILRTAAEFALEHRDICSVYCGSFTEILATMYAHGVSTTSSLKRALGDFSGLTSLAQRLAVTSTPEEFTNEAMRFGLSISTRSSRRIMDGSIAEIPSLMERLSQESFPQNIRDKSAVQQTSGRTKKPKCLKLDDNDVENFKKQIARAYEDIAQRYFLEPGVEPELKVSQDCIRITIPIESLL